MHRQLSVFACLVVLGCAPREGMSNGEPFQPYPGSKVVHSAQQTGNTGVEYEVSVPYPSKPVIEFIEAHVPPGFQPRKEDFMNPGVPTSHVRGWTNYGDDTSQPPSWVHHWASQWEDSAGNILSYDLMYRSQGAHLVQPASTNLHVFGHYYSRNYVEEIKKTLSVESRREAAAKPKPSIVVTNPSYVVLRPFSTEKRANAQEVSRDGTTFYFDPADVLIDLSHVHSVEVDEGPSGSHILVVETSDAGSTKLHTWTSANVGQHLGVFLDGKLIATPKVMSPLDDMFILDGQFTEAQAKDIAARIQRGGAP